MSAEHLAAMRDTLARAAGIVLQQSADLPLFIGYGREVSKLWYEYERACEVLVESGEVVNAALVWLEDRLASEAACALMASGNFNLLEHLAAFTDRTWAEYEARCAGLTGQS